MGSRLHERCRLEIEELHRFYADWLVGRVPGGSEGLRRLRDVLHADFEVVTPQARVLGPEALIEALCAAHGGRSSTRAFDVRVEGFMGRSLGPGLHLVRYLEWQVWPQESRGWLNSALFGEREGTPHGVEWLYLHEAAIPLDGARDAGAAPARPR